MEDENIRPELLVMVEMQGGVSYVGHLEQRLRDELAELAVLAELHRKEQLRPWQLTNPDGRE